MWGNLFSRKAAGPSLAQTLAYIPVFSQLSRREQVELSRLVHIRRFTMDETIIQGGAEQSGVYLIRSGTANIVRERLAPDGEPVREIVGTLGPSELLGEFALLDGTPRTTSVIAAEAAELIGFFKPDLMDLLDTKPALGCKILLRLAEGMSRSLARDCEKIRDMRRADRNRSVSGSLTAVETVALDSGAASAANKVAADNPEALAAADVVVTANAVAGGG